MINVESLKEDLARELQNVANKHGLTPGQLKIVYSDVDVKISLVMVETQAPDIQAEFVRNLRKNGHFYNLTLDHLNRDVIIGLSTATFQGLRGKKAVLKQSSGKLVFHDASIISQLLKISNEPKDYSSATPNSD
jgi:hypothetical protein